MAYYEADSEDSLRDAFARFAAESSRPAILSVSTPEELSAEVLIGYFHRAELLG